MWTWSARRGWGDAHRLALAGGGLLTYAWHSFVEQPVGAGAAAIDLIGNAIFTLGALALIWFAWRRLSRGPAVDTPAQPSAATMSAASGPDEAGF